MVQHKQLAQVTFGCAVCAIIGYFIGDLISGSRIALAVVAGALAIGVGFYLYWFENEVWKIRFLEFMFLEVLIAGFVYEAWFAHS